MDVPLCDIKPHYKPTPDGTSCPATETPDIQSTIQTLGLQPHIKGGYFVETDRDKTQVFQTTTGDLNSLGYFQTPGSRALSTTIFYFLTTGRPLGAFHRNKSRTVHTLHHGRGVYVLLTPRPGAGDLGDIHVETFVVGHDIARGEKLQWIVEGGSYKASFLIPDRDGEAHSSGLLISETVTPGFEYEDHDFLEQDALKAMVNQEVFDQLKWLLRRGHA
ncbi:RmlC-like cupin domain-containing protein [Aspergillus egyptiacus]|nr:RmlC-like cupin domain-containing protein [Aspergillus egyptiacus]